MMMPWPRATARGLILPSAARVSLYAVLDKYWCGLSLSSKLIGHFHIVIDGRTLCTFASNFF